MNELDLALPYDEVTVAIVILLWWLLRRRRRKPAPTPTPAQ